MSYPRGQVYSLPFNLPNNLPHGLGRGPPTPPVITHSRLITEDDNVAPTGPNFPIITEDGNHLVTNQ